MSLPGTVSQEGPGDASSKHGEPAARGERGQSREGWTEGGLFPGTSVTGPLGSLNHVSFLKETETNYSSVGLGRQRKDFRSRLPVTQLLL